MANLEKRGPLKSGAALEKRDRLLSSTPSVSFAVNAHMALLATSGLSDVGRTKTVQQNAYDEDLCAKEFGIKISEKLATVEARVLPAPWVVEYDYY